jgi:hypothetical protein
VGDERVRLCTLSPFGRTLQFRGRFKGAVGASFSLENAPLQRQLASLPP